MQLELQIHFVLLFVCTISNGKDVVNIDLSLFTSLFLGYSAQSFQLVVTPLLGKHFLHTIHMKDIFCFYGINVATLNEIK